MFSASKILQIMENGKMHREHCLDNLLTALEYLELRVKHLRNRNPAIHAADYRKVNSLFERALILLNKMPRIWELYLDFLLQQPLITLTRKAA